jgi:hypothetical protein
MLACGPQKLARGRFRDVHPLLYGVAALFVVYFLRGVLEDWLPAGLDAGPTM